MTPLASRSSSALGRPSRAAAALALLLAVGCTPKVPPPPEIVQDAPPPQEEAPLEVVPAIEVEIAPLPLSPEPEPIRRAAPSEVHCAILLPLSGPRAGLGKALLDAAQLALFDHADEHLTLLPKDTGGTAAGAEQAMGEALAEGVDIVLGPLLASSVRTVRHLAQGRGVAMIAFTNDRSVAGPGVYVMGITPAQQIERVVAYATDGGRARFAALVPDDAYGAAVLEGLREATRRHAAAVGPVEYFVPGQVSVGESEPVRRLVASGGYDALLIAAGGGNLRVLAPLFPYYNLDPDEVRLLGTALWKDDAVLGEPALIDGWFAAPPEDAFAAFADRFRGAFAAAPPRLASLAYDAVALTALLARAPGGADFSAAVLTDDEGFAGVDGLFRFRDDGLAERGLTVYRVAPRSFEVLDPAPAAFGAAVF